MFKILEVVGISSKGFSEAVQDAVKKLHEVIEQRGAVKEGNIKEFQVKLKAGIKTAPPAADTKSRPENACPTCLQQTGAAGHLCIPTTAIDQKCDWCGAMIPDARHMCNDKLKEMAYVCSSCGRTAIAEEHLCSPKKIK